MAQHVVIVGSGVIGMTIAYYLKTRLEQPPKITIIAREIPKRKNEQHDDWIRGQWASPWAGAIFVASLHEPRLPDIEAESYKHFWKIGHQDPSCGVEFRLVRHYYDNSSLPDPSKLYVHKFVHKFRHLREHELPVQRRGISGGIEYQSMCVNPWVYLPWLRTELEQLNVHFVQATVSSLNEAVALVSTLTGDQTAPIVVNSTGVGAKTLNDVRDELVTSVRGQTMWVQTDYTGPMAVREGLEYTYFIPRAFSQGSIFGGISEEDNQNPAPEQATKRDILTRVRDLVPDAVEAALTVPEDPDLRASPYQGLNVIKDIVGFRPGRKTGFRIESEELHGLRIVHAYGFESTGYICSAGAARRCVDIIKQLKSPDKLLSKL
jgi:D-amino-acid oxidase